ncbi:hypothetical protein BJX76DRAFT_360220 [Aspergillus varians]
MSNLTLQFNQRGAADYLRETPLCKDYIKAIKKWRQRDTGPPLPPREDLVDHLWSNIFALYFQMHRTAPYDFGIERESYVADNSQARSNITIVHISGNRRTRRKAIMFEVKRPVDPGTNSLPSEDLWNEVNEQLRRYMRQAAEGETIVSHKAKPMFGITAIGLYARRLSSRRKVMSCRRSWVGRRSM